MAARYPQHLFKLIAAFKKLPGVGSKTAERFAFNLLAWSPQKIAEMAQDIAETTNKIRYCDQCGAMLGDRGQCPFCADDTRDRSTLCVVAAVKEVYAIEASREYRGLYHVLGGVLSPLQGYRPEHLSLEKLYERVRQLGVKEIVIALDSTLEGDATALFLKKKLAGAGINISRLAFGLPMGSSLEFVDEGTLGFAMSGRREF